MPKVAAERAVVHVPFDNDSIEAVPDGGRVLVPLRPLCERLGLEPGAQRKRLQRHSWACAAMMAVQVGDQTRELFCLDLDSLPMWLATIDTRRVRPEVRPKLERYQREAARVLRDHFFGHADPVPAALPPPDMPDVRELALIAARGDLDALVRALPLPPGDPAAAALTLLEQAHQLMAIAAKLRPRRTAGGAVGVPAGPPPKAIGAGGTSSEDPALQVRVFKELIEGRPQLRALAEEAFRTSRKGLTDEAIDMVRRCCAAQLLETLLRSDEAGWLRVPSREVMRCALTNWRMYRPGVL